MKRFFGWLSVLVMAVGVLGAGEVFAQNTQNFSFDSFSAQYYLDRTAEKTATLTVAETLTARFPDFDQNHGILRALPKSYQGHTISLNIDSVTDSTGTPRDYSTYTENHNLVLKIGNPKTYVHGVQTYIITYQMRNVILFGKNQDEFYWDVNGDQWAQTFDKVSAQIHVPAKIATSLQPRQVCYAGDYGQTLTSTCSIGRQVTDSETVVTTSTNEPLGPRKTLTFALAFNKGTFVLGPEIAREQQINHIKKYIAVVAIVLPPIVAAVVMFKRWRQFGNDPKGRGVIIPEYEPPQGFNVLSSDFLLNQSLQPVSLSAALIELAVGKFLLIKEIRVQKRLRRDSNDYELEIARDISSASEELQMIAKAVFVEAAKGAKIKISDIKASTTKRTDIYNATTKLASHLANTLTYRKFFVKNPKDVKKVYMLWAVLPTAVGGGLVFLSGPLSFYPVAFLGAGLLLAGLVMFCFAFAMPARTEKGAQTHDHLLGLKEYIKMAEADRLKFGQSVQGAEKIAGGSFDPSSPRSQVKLFETLLPYAMLFGLEKSWTEQFKDLYAQSPNWYSGNIHTFNTVYLASSLSNFSSASSMSFSPPSSSSSGGFSGGGAGGGGGGGGGGGW